MIYAALGLGLLVALGVQERPQDQAAGNAPVVVRHVPTPDTDQRGPQLLDSCQMQARPTGDMTPARPLLRDSAIEPAARAGQVRFERTFMVTVNGCQVPQIIRYVPEADAASDNNLMPPQARGWAAE